MAKPRTFIEKKSEPGMGVPKSLDRELRLSIENVIENIKRLQQKIKALEDGAASVESRLSTTDDVEAPSSSQGIELYDSLNIPPAPPLPYLRFERDIDGDVQFIYIGTDD